MSMFFSSLDIPPITVFWVLIGILGSGLGSYWLYRILLTPMVEHGESHPANVRRGMWTMFFGLSELVAILLLQSWLRPTAFFALISVWIVFALVVLFTRKRA